MAKQFPPEFRRDVVKVGVITEMLRLSLETTQFTSLRHCERIADIAAVPSIGFVGDSYDNALAETVNSLYETELIQ